MLFHLELVSNSKLNLSRRISGGHLGKMAEIRAVKNCRWGGKSCRVRHVEDLGAELKIRFVSYRDVLENRNVEAAIMRTVELIIPLIAERAGRLRHEGTGVEESAHTGTVESRLAYLVRAISSISSGICVAHIAGIQDGERKSSRPHPRQIYLPGLYHQSFHTPGVLPEWQNVEDGRGQTIANIDAAFAVV